MSEIGLEGTNSAFQKLPVPVGILLVNVAQQFCTTWLAFLKSKMADDIPQDLMDKITKTQNTLGRIIKVRTPTPFFLPTHPTLLTLPH